MDSLRKKSIAPPPHTHVEPKTEENPVACAVEKRPSSEINFRGHVFLLLTYNIWCAESSVH